MAQSGTGDLTAKMVEGKYYSSGYDSPYLKLKSNSRFKYHYHKASPKPKPIHGTWSIKEGKIFIVKDGGGKLSFGDGEEDYSVHLVKVSDGNIELWSQNGESCFFIPYIVRLKR